MKRPALSALAAAALLLLAAIPPSAAAQQRKSPAQQNPARNPGLYAIFESSMGTFGG